MDAPDTPPTGRWLIAAGQPPTDEPYPCSCPTKEPCRTYWHPAYRCPCSGRTDLDNVPDHCCGHIEPQGYGR